MKVLHMTSALDGGGVDSILFNYCTRMMPEVQSDFLVSSDYEGVLERPLLDCGCKIFHIEKIRGQLFVRQQHIKKILETGGYDIVHDHSGYKSFFLLELAKRLGIQCRIAHSHIAFVPESIKRSIERKFFTYASKKVATNLFACGVDAALWMWGRKCFNDGKIKIMPNGIDTKEYRYSDFYRQKLRNDLGIGDKFVIGCVARLTEQKNHIFLLRIFRKIKENVPDAILLLIGQGELFDEIKKETEELNIYDSVRFLGVRTDVAQLLSVMDVFVLTSKYEGLPVTLVEAQANGIPIVTSDSITEEIKINSNYKMISLNEPELRWAQTIIDSRNNRISNVINLIKKYDIDILSVKQKQWYMKQVANF